MANAEKDIAVLLKNLTKGDEKAYMSLIDLYYKKLFGYAYSLTKDAILSEDIVQNVFMRIWENRKSLKITESIKSFLYKSVYNDFINTYRKQQSSVVLDKIYHDTLTSFVTDEETNLLERKVALLKCEIDLLPTKCKQVFLLSKEEGLTNLEISEYLTISKKAVESHITNAYTILRTKVENKLKEFGL
ncbi:RNA polymerase sigma-70 factor (ECF subfamily) [Wenyingzhuangia heitensis]|uniref:RNA polymerase sigma-70 factor (ECF subfamily) n=1 Tax=Wenyingzhuangia heitensis TaxID=1487859 RepID=A0ABX0UCJ3_9FLAO|nr:sigma-70 family RNA polymerase sigma factor [Wenyingzhuangia heitensis]NIJ45535.1 RNA polymerase sigma-70 factor (ECF subfamily) [Wenyingzhuangia heitensis]